MAKCVVCKNNPKQEKPELYFHCKGDYAGSAFDVCFRCLLKMIQEGKPAVVNGVRLW